MARVYDLSLTFNRDMPTYYFYKNVFDPPFFTIVSHPKISSPDDGFDTCVTKPSSGEEIFGWLTIVKNGGSKTFL